VRNDRSQGLAVMARPPGGGGARAGAGALSTRSPGFLACSYSLHEAGEPGDDSSPNPLIDGAFSAAAIEKML
jgi:hypothetical protein